MPYPLPSWLQAPPAPNPAQEYQQGLHLGAQIQQAHESLSQQAQESAVRTQVAVDESQREHAFREQQAALAHAQQQQQLDMQRQQLQMAQQLNEVKLRDAADRFAASEELARTPPEQQQAAMMRLFPRLYRGSSGAGMASAMRAMRQAEPPKQFEMEFNKRKYGGFYNPQTGAGQFFPGQAQVGGKLTQEETAQIADLKEQRKPFMAALSDPTMEMALKNMTEEQRKKSPITKGIEEAKKKVKYFNDEINKLNHRAKVREANKVPEFNYDPKTGQLTPVTPEGEVDDEEATADDTD